MFLRPYQERGINDIRAQFSNGHKRICFVAPCGAGKTILMAYMAQQAAKNGNRTTFLVHRQELIGQASETFAAFGIYHGIISPEYQQTDDMIQIASVQTLSRRLGRVSVPDLLITDECHHATAKTWQNIMDTYPNAYSVGLTATPARLNGQGLSDVYDVLVQGPSAKELIKTRHLTPYKYYAPPMAIDLDGIKICRGDYDVSEIAEKVDKPKIIGDAIEHYKRLARGKRAIVYCANRAHSQHTAAAFNEAGFPAAHIDGTTPKSERTQRINDFRSGEITVLTNVDLFGEGFDVPGIEAVILLRPTASLTLYIQQSMRGMRPDPKNPFKTAVILDHVGNVGRHGLPDEDREWSLDGTKKQSRLNGPRIGIRQCPCCYWAHLPSPKCPGCGYVYQISARQLAEESGELEEYLARERAKEEADKKQQKQEVGRCRTMEELKAIATARGYAPGWVRIQAKLKNIRG